MSSKVKKESNGLPTPLRTVIEAAAEAGLSGESCGCFVDGFIFAV